MVVVPWAAWDHGTSWLFLMRHCRPPLDAAALNARLVRPGGLWREIRVSPETGSTNADLLREAQAGAG